MRKKLLGIGLIFLLLFTFGCSKSISKSNNSTSPSYEDSKKPSEAPASEGSKGQGTEVKVSKIIRNYNLNLTVDDLQKLSRDMESKVKELGGYVQNDESSDSYMRAVVRVPSDKSDSFLEHLEKNYEVKDKRTNVEDITQGYIDNEARLNNLKAQETQTLEIMKRANTVDEVLRVQNELFRVRGEIEILENTKRNWDRLIDYATITVYANKKALVNQNEVKIIGVNDFFKAIGNGIVNSSKSLVYGLQMIFIFILGNVIWITLLAIAGVFIYRRYLKPAKSQNSHKE